MNSQHDMSKYANIENIDSILAPWQNTIGDDYQGYRNHVVRMATFCLMLKPCTAEEQRKIEIAACFHDIGIWTEQTLDYLPPSVPPAMQYLEDHGLAAWSDEIRDMILDHHKLTKVEHGVTPLVERFRKGDLVDFSLGLVRNGLDKRAVAEVKAKFPNAGFHPMLVRRAAKWIIKNPLNPLPMMKW